MVLQEFQRAETVTSNRWDVDYTENRGESQSPSARLELELNMPDDGPSRFSPDDPGSESSTAVISLEPIQLFPRVILSPGALRPITPVTPGPASTAASKSR
jgi:hypothetical protein